MWSHRSQPEVYIMVWKWQNFSIQRWLKKKRKWIQIFLQVIVSRTGLSVHTFDTIDTGGSRRGHGSVIALSIAHGKFRLAIKDTSFWTFCEISTQGTFRHILGSILVIFELFYFLTIPGLFEYFSESGYSKKINVFSMKEWWLPPLLV